MAQFFAELTLRELRAAQATVRGELVNATNLAQLLGADRSTAERLLQPGVPMWAMERVVLGRLVGRLRGFDTTPDELEEAMTVHRRLARSEAITPAPDLTIDEMRAAEALLRGQDADIGASAAFLACSRSAVRRLVLITGDTRVLDSLLFVALLLRLHGRRVALAEMGEALLAAIAKERTRLLREVAH